MLYQDKKKDKLFFFGHRGAPKLERENTLESIQKAIEMGCDGIELDIQMTSDNILILFHDVYITHNNKKCYISNLSHEEINNILARQHTPEASLFDDFMLMVKKHPDIVFNIEIKSQHFINRKIVQKLYSTLSNDSGVMNQLIVSSFDFLIMLHCKHFFHRDAIALIICSHRAQGVLKNIVNKILVQILNPKFIHLSKSFLNNQIIRWAKDRNIFVNMYTINTNDMLQQCIENKIDGIFTDDHHFYASSDQEEDSNYL